MNFEQIRQAQALKSKLDKVQKELKECRLKAKPAKAQLRRGKRRAKKSCR